MNSDHTRHARTGRFAGIISLFFVASLAAACGSGTAATQSDDNAKQKAQQEERTPEAPTPEELAESPCGNPDWARLPKQHRENGDPSSEEESADKDSETEKPSDASTSD